MKTIVHTADSRGNANHGWLNSYHTFSFANYYNPERIQFGALRVLNDDTVQAGMGFGTHPHNNMEIISIPLEGDLEHKDSMGNSGVIRKGEIQVMSAGTGIRHSEFNKNKDKEVKFLQIWVIPNKENVEPRYGQRSITDLQKENDLFQIISPDAADKGLWIHQDAWFHMGFLKPDYQSKYTLKGSAHGVYAFLIEGEAEIGGQALQRRDAVGIWETTEFDILIKKDAHLLLMEVPMT